MSLFLLSRSFIPHFEKVFPTRVGGSNSYNPGRYFYCKPAAATLNKECLYVTYVKLLQKIDYSSDDNIIFFRVTAFYCSIIRVKNNQSVCFDEKFGEEIWKSLMKTRERLC